MMKKRFLYGLLASILLAVISCKKQPIKEPPPPSKPVFSLTGTLNGENFIMEAGENNAFMETFVKAQNGVNCFSGKLTDGQIEISLGIYDGNLDIPFPSIPPIFPASLINLATISPLTPLVTLSKNAFPNAASMSYIAWKIDNEPMGQNDVSIFQPGKYTVCAEIHFNNGTIENVCNELYVGYKRNATAKVKQAVTQPGSVHLWIENNTLPIAELKWFVDGQYVSSQVDFTGNISPMTHLVTAEIYFQNGTKRRQSALVDGTANNHFVDDFSSVEAQNQSVQWDHHAVITIKKGEKCYTSVCPPNQTQSILIDQFNYFGKNPQGKKVYIVHGTVNCSLKEVNSTTIVPFSATMHLGVAVE
jgi:hypothetical protein